MLEESNGNVPFLGDFSRPRQCKSSAGGTVVKGRQNIEALTCEYMCRRSVLPVVGVPCYSMSYSSQGTDNKFERYTRITKKIMEKTSSGFCCGE